MPRMRTSALLCAGFLGGVVLTSVTLGVVRARARQEPSPVARVPAPVSLPSAPLPSPDVSAPDPGPALPSAPADPLPVAALGAEPPLSPTDLPAPPLDSAVGRSSDPEKDANDFVERARKQTADSVTRLRGEAKSLRERLAKVESALRRWEQLLAALSAKPAETPPQETVLEAVPREDHVPALAPVSPPPVVPEPALLPQIPAPEPSVEH